MDLQITLLSRFNLHLLEQVAPDVFDQPVDPPRLPAYLSDPAQRLFLAVTDGQVIGQLKAVIHRHIEKPPDLFIEELGVSPAYQRRGVATALSVSATTLAENLGCSEIWLATEPENEAANALYRNLQMAGQHVVVYARPVRRVRGEASPAPQRDI